MEYRVLMKIKDNFEDIYDQMKSPALRRFKHIKMLIANSLKVYSDKIRPDNAQG